MPGKRVAKWIAWIVGSAISLLVLWIALLAFGALIAPSPHTGIFERVWRHLNGEPGATQEVNDLADIIVAGGYANDLALLGDSLFHEFDPQRAHLKPGFGGLELPIERLPMRYRRMRGRFDPELLLQKRDSVISVSWWHMRRSIDIYMEPPAAEPVGFHVRKVHPRVFVVARDI